MPVGVQALRPKSTTLIDGALVKTAVPAAHAVFAAGVIAKMSHYPPQRGGTRYRRTGDYGRGWSGPGSVQITPAGVTIVNRIRYAVYVGGPWPQSGRAKGERQTIVNRRVGWASISDVARAQVKLAKPLYNKAIRGRPG